MTSPGEPALPTELLAFVHDTHIADIPAPVQAIGQRCLLDLLGVAAAGRTTALSAIIHDHVVEHFAAGGASAPLLFDGRRVSPAGAALANGMTIDAVDAHDGHNLTKGHSGCHQLPALLAVFTAEGLEEPDLFRSSLVVGYEVATRAGIALHRSAADYHTSGAWGAVGAAALGARLLGLDRRLTFEAMGIAEYHGPRSQMMRAIDHPTMVKDGSGWGAMAGVSAAYLASAGFTGAPAVTVTDPAVADVWSSLGTHWIIADQYVKPYPICRWAQPAVEAAMALRNEHAIRSDDIEAVTVHTFHEAARLATVHPTTTEQAQYSLPFPVAAALCRGRLGPAEIGHDGLDDSAIAALARAVRIVEDPAHDQAFPRQRFARVTITCRDGRTFTSRDTEPRGEAGDQLTSDEIDAKFRALATPTTGVDRAAAIQAAIADPLDIAELLELIVPAAS